ncbi:hypothetical protein RGUI_1141 [Rhodovulum sp. P5]|uniref:carboxypeptidase-like regulatory domain-containing protein n=1 Tax=Rhodovulum sp. P5 TaxID=1564506 RepID=UPI0009C3B459|nr:carboxypeptidase-like regulatory domain-containing protein [Rhodovulum sp. P5]ARE39282.1 hypothetical protein RGUI_1141 [Rhodovulum sp. P5]
MTRLSILTAALCGALALPAAAADAVKGMVVTQTNTPVQGYPVMIVRERDGATFVAITSYGGFFTMGGLLPGAYRIKGATQTGDWLTFQLPPGKGAIMDLPRIVVQTGRVVK